MRRLLLLASALLVTGAPAASASTIVYQCGHNICTIDPAVRKVHKLTTRGTKDLAYRLAGITRDGKWVSFYDPRAKALVRVTPRGKGRKVVYRKEVGFDPRVSPSGKHYLWWFLLGNQYVYEYTVGQASPVSIAGTVGVISYGWRREQAIGGLFHEGGSADAGSDICVIKAGGERCDALLLHDKNHLISFPDGTADGKRVVAVSEPSSGGDTLAKFEGPLAVYDLAKKRRVVSLTTGKHDSLPHWSRDGKRVVFQRGDNKICLVDLKRRKVITLAKGVNPFWGG